MYVRAVRFTDVTAERVEQLLAGIEESGGPPPDVPATGLQMLFDETQGTAVVLQFFANRGGHARRGPGLRCYGALRDARHPHVRGHVRAEARAAHWLALGQRPFLHAERSAAREQTPARDDDRLSRMASSRLPHRQWRAVARRVLGTLGDRPEQASRTPARTRSLVARRRSARRRGISVVRRR